MNLKSPVIIFLMSALGLLFGYQMRHGSSNEIRSASTTVNLPRSPAIAPESANGEKTSAVKLPRIQSAECLETIVAKGAGVTYAELAIWLVDATALDIAAYWRARLSIDIPSDSNGDMTRLIFYNWTRLDPWAAIAAVAGTNRAMSPWHAWGANDPQAALAAAGPEQLKSVANGIGQMQPEWLRKNFDQIPAEFRKAALDGLITWTEASEPEAKMDFLIANGMGFSSHTFGAFARKDPWAAYDWLAKNGKLDATVRGPINQLLDAMKSIYPDDLERMAAMTPSGAIKRKIEDAMFENLLATAPEAALAKAKSMEAPLVAVKRLAEIGASLLVSDQEKAFQIGADILAISPGKLEPELRIRTGENGIDWGNSEGATKDFMKSLMVKDPARTLNMATAEGEDAAQTFQTLAGQWAKRDLGAYVEWVNQQSDHRTRTLAARQVIDQLSSQGHFQEAAEWVMSGEKPDPSNLATLCWQWGRSNPQEALNWVESANLPEEAKRDFKNQINSSK